MLKLLLNWKVLAAIVVVAISIWLLSKLFVILAVAGLGAIVWFQLRKKR